jgi:hypothetical protein
MHLVCITLVPLYSDGINHHYCAARTALQSKIQETKDLMKKKAQEIEKVRIEAARGGPSRMGAISSMQGGGPGSMGGGMGGSMGGGMGGGRAEMDTGPSYRPEAAAAAGYGSKEPPRGVKKGMQVGLLLWLPALCVDTSVVCCTLQP